MTNKKDWTFSVALGCSNCGATWDETVPYRTEVKSGWDGLYLHPADAIGTWASCQGRYVVCDRCGLTNKVGRREHDAEDARKDALIAQLVVALEAVERWEADVILEHRCWVNATGLPHITQALWDQLIEMQAGRNAALAAARDRGAAREAAMTEPTYAEKARSLVLEHMVEWETTPPDGDSLAAWNTVGRVLDLALRLVTAQGAFGEHDCRCGYFEKPCFRKVALRAAEAAVQELWEART